MFSEREVIGVLGMGTFDIERAFTAVDLRIIKRLAERIGSQVVAAQLERFRERETMQAHELQIAREIQQSVQPLNSPRNPQLEIASYWQPAKEVGGDAWGWVELQNGRLAWFILDVAGKGLPAALAAVALHTAISMALRMQMSPSDTLRIVNEQLYDAYTRTGLMATAAVICLNPVTGLQGVCLMQSRPANCFLRYVAYGVPSCFWDICRILLGITATNSIAGFGHGSTPRTTFCPMHGGSDTRQSCFPPPAEAGGFQHGGFYERKNSGYT